MIVDGIIVTFLGMTIVFLFLGLMVILTNSIAWILRNEPIEQLSTPKPLTNQSDDLIAIAIAIAKSKAEGK